VTVARKIAERLASALAGPALVAMLASLVGASIVVTPRPVVRDGAETAVASERVSPAARGGARVRDGAPPELAAAPVVTASPAVADVADMPAADVAEVAPDPTPAPTPAPAPRPTARPTAPPASAAPPVTTSVRDAELRMLALMNASRAQGGLVALTLDAGVSTAARAHSRVESRVGYVYHDGPDGTAASRDGAACGSGWYGENTGKVWEGNVDRLHGEFMSEPWAPINHRTNIMDPAFRRVGIGAVEGPDALYMTMVFCR